MIKKLKKITVIALCAVIVMCSAVSPLTVSAMTDSSASKIVDVALTKTGIVANKSVLNAVEDKLANVVRDTLKLYDAWLDENPSKEVGVETFNEFVDGGGLSTFAYKAIEPHLNRKFIVTLMLEYRDSLDDAPVDITEVITGETSILGKILNLPSALVNFIRSLFNEYATENSDFYYIDTYTASDVNPLWFESPQAYQNFCYQINNVSELVYIRAKDSINVVPRTDDTSGVICEWYLHKFDNEVLFVDNSYSKYRWRIDLYNENWEKGYDVYMTEKEPLTQSEIGQFTFDDCTRLVSGWMTMSDYMDIYVSGATIGHLGIWTNDGRPIKVYKNETAMKNATLGKCDYYVTNNSNKYETTDNSVNVSGDYLVSDSYTYSHDIVQTEIDNSETITNETVNNIVNNNTTTIINNYASSVSPDGGSSDEGGGGILDGLGGLVSGITDFVGFLLGLVGDALSLITSLFTTLFDAVKAIGSVFTGFTGLLGDIFGFIPSELVNFLVLAVEAAVAVAIWKQFKK